MHLNYNTQTLNKNNFETQHLIECNNVQYDPTVKNCLHNMKGHTFGPHALNGARGIIIIIFLSIDHFESLMIYSQGMTRPYSKPDMCDKYLHICSVVKTRLIQFVPCNRAMTSVEPLLLSPILIWVPKARTSHILMLERYEYLKTFVYLIPFESIHHAKNLCIFVKF